MLSQQKRAKIWEAPSWRPARPVREALDASSLSGEAASAACPIACCCCLQSTVRCSMRPGHPGPRSCNLTGGCGARVCISPRRRCASSAAMQQERRRNSAARADVQTRLALIRVRMQPAPWRLRTAPAAPASAAGGRSRSGYRAGPLDLERVGFSAQVLAPTAALCLRPGSEEQSTPAPARGDGARSRADWSLLEPESPSRPEMRSANPSGGEGGVGETDSAPDVVTSLSHPRS